MSVSEKDKVQLTILTLNVKNRCLLFSESEPKLILNEWIMQLLFIPAFQHRRICGAVGIAGLYIGRLRNCLPFLTSFTQCRMANLHIKCLYINGL